MCDYLEKVQASLSMSRSSVVSGSFLASLGMIGSGQLFVMDSLIIFSGTEVVLHVVLAQVPCHSGFVSIRLG